MAALPHARYEAVALAGVRPLGWLLEFLQRQCAGLSGHPEASGYPLDHTFWDDPSRLPDVSDPAMTWWPYEQTAYWVDGALKAGFLAGNEAVHRMALAQIDGAIATAAPDGFIGPEMFRDRTRWPYLIFFRAVLAQYQTRATGGWSTPWSGTIGALRTRWDSLATCPASRFCWPCMRKPRSLIFWRWRPTCTRGSTARRPSRAVTPPWPACVRTARDRPWGLLQRAREARRAVYAATGDRASLTRRSAYGKVESDHLLADGMHSGAEAMSGNDPLESYQTCGITDFTWSLGHLLQIIGDPHYADRLERVIFNALPGALTKDFSALQYFSCPNQVIATNTSNHNPMSRGDNRMEYRPGHPVQCCTGNVQRAMPNYVDRMWMRGRGGIDEIVAALFGPSRIEVVLSDTQVTIEQHTRYPFEPRVGFTLTPQRPVCFVFSVRIPGWCRDPVVRSTARFWPRRQSRGASCIEREWQPDDRVGLSLPSNSSRGAGRRVASVSSWAR